METEKQIEMIKISALPNMGSTQLTGDSLVAGVVNGETLAVPVERIAKLASQTEVVGANEFEQLWDAAP